VIEIGQEQKNYYSKKLRTDAHSVNRKFWSQKAFHRYKQQFYGKSSAFLKYSTFSLNTIVYLLQKQLNVSAIEGSLHLDVYRNKMKIFTVGLF